MIEKCPHAKFNEIDSYVWTVSHADRCTTVDGQVAYSQFFRLERKLVKAYVLSKTSQHQLSFVPILFTCGGITANNKGLWY